MGRFKQVSREEFLEFVKNYPNKLHFDCAGFYEPLLCSYNDFSNEGFWPGTIVAKEIREFLGPNGEVDESKPGKYWSYFILKDIDDK